MNAHPESAYLPAYLPGNSQSNTTNKESTLVPETSGDSDSCLFFTPDTSLTSDLKFTSDRESYDEPFHTIMELETPSHIRDEKNLSFKVEGSSQIPIIMSTPLQPTKKPKRRYVRRDKKYAEENSTEIAISDGILKTFECDQCTKRCSTMRALNIHKFMHKRKREIASSNDVTRSLAS